jgi:putative copper export protein
MFIRGNVSGSRSFAMWWLLLSALVSLNLVWSATVGGATLQPSSWKYCRTLRGLAMSSVWCGSLLDLLFVLDLEIFSQIVDVYLKVIHNERRGSDMCHEVVNVPARHVIRPVRVSTVEIAIPQYVL